MPQNILVIGGTGAQGGAVVKELSKTHAYSIFVLTRRLDSEHALKIAQLPGVKLIEGNCHDANTLRQALKGMELVFVNTDGAAIGEQAEIYWGQRTYELAREAGLKHFVYGGLDYVYKKSGFDPKYRCNHLDGKGKVIEYLAQQATSPMAWTAICSGPYIQMLGELLRPSTAADGTIVFHLPLADGVIDFINLDDLAKYTLWAFRNPSRANGLNLEIATQHASGQDLADALTKVTGKKAAYNNVPIEDWLEKSFGELRFKKMGPETGDDAQTYAEDFGAWWRVYQASGKNRAMIGRDYRLLDDILPERVKSVEEWMRAVGYEGEYKPLLKSWADKSEEVK